MSNQPTKVSQAPLYITFEGIDGCGKTSVLEGVKKKLEEVGLTCEATQALPEGAIRDAVIALVDSAESTTVEQMIYLLKASSVYIEDRIEKSLSQGKIVLCDRGPDSLFAYQGYGYGKIGFMENLFDVFPLSVTPGITFYLRLDPDKACERLQARGKLDSIEKLGVDFQKTVSRGYDLLAEKNCGRIVTIDANLPLNTVISEITSRIFENLTAPGSYTPIKNPENRLHGLSYGEVKRAVAEDPLDLRYVYKQTEELCKIAVQQNGYALQHVHRQTEELCKLAVQQSGYALAYVREQTEEICKAAVQQNGYALQYVRDQTEEICRLPVQLHGKKYTWVIHDVREQTEELCKLAVENSPESLRYVREQTEEICKLAVQQSGYALRYVHEQTEELCKLAVQQTGYALKYVKVQTEEICRLAVKQSPLALQYVRDKTDEICRLAIEQNQDAARYV